MNANPESKRVLGVGHQGLRNWVIQRATAVLMALFTLALLSQLIFFRGPLGYDKWAGIFATLWMKALTVIAIAALIWHVWLGMRDIFMDYIKPARLRLALQGFTVAWLVACAGWAIRALGRL